MDLVAEVGTIIVDELDDGTPQYTATWDAPATPNSPPAHFWVTWDDVHRRGIPHPKQRWRIRFEPLD